MIDDTPEVKWSTAWWIYWGAGVWLPLLLIVFALYTFFAEHSYVPVLLFRSVEFVEVFGFQAKLMATGYLAFAISCFARGHLHYHRALCHWSEPILALSLIGALIPITWCAILFFV